MFSSLHPCFLHRLAPLLLNKWISAWKCVMHITFQQEAHWAPSTIKEQCKAHRALFAFLFKALCDLLWGLFMLSNANSGLTAAYITHQLKYINRSGTWWLVIVLVTREQRTEHVLGGCNPEKIVTQGLASKIKRHLADVGQKVQFKCSNLSLFCFWQLDVHTRIVFANFFFYSNSSLTSFHSVTFPLGAPQHQPCVFCLRAS